jgi:hypothetical protein
MFWMKTTSANIVRAMNPKQPPSADYRKRLKGNLMAYRDLLLFRLDPENILKIPDSAGSLGQPQRGTAWRSEPRRSIQNQSAAEP